MSPADGGPVPELLRRFVVRFDRGEYWLAHEELEELWLTDRRDVYKGLIHLAAAMVHVGRGNWRGALAKSQSSRDLLAAQPDHGLPLDLEALGDRVRDLVVQAQALVADPARGFDPTRRIRLAPLFDSPVDVTGVGSEQLPYRVRRHDAGYRVGRDPRLRD